TYTVDDGNGGSDTATVTVTVDAVNDLPVAENDAVTTDEDTSVTIDLLANDSDVDGDSLAVTLGTPSNGSVVFDQGQFIYTPDADFNGTDSFTYTVDDGNGGSDTATVSIVVNPVNDAPVASDDTFSTGFGATLNIAAVGVLLNDTDVEGDVLSAVLDTGPSNGTLTLNSDGSFDYTPDAGFSGTDSFTYFANDGTEDSAAPATVTITVSSATNTNPVAGDDAVTTDEDSPVEIDLLANDTDADGDTLGVSLGTPSNGAVAFDDGAYVYTPDADFNGTDSFTYTIDDGNGGTDTATVTVTVNAVNDPPVAEDDSGTGFETDENTTFTTASVLLNDTDVDGDSLTVTGIDVSSTLGSVTDNGDGTFDYNPNGLFELLGAGESITDAFGYTISDGNGGQDTAIVTITITGVNDVPVAEDDVGIDFTTDADTMFTTGSVLLNDTDVDLNDVLSVTGIDTTGTIGTVTDNGDGTFDYDPNDLFEGLGVGETATDTFSYTISDGNGGSDTATVSITVNGVNDTPVAVADGGTGFSTDEDAAFTTASVLANDTDPDTNDLLTVLSIDTTGTVGFVIDNGDGTFDYDPSGMFDDLDDGETATDTFIYSVSDGNGGTDTETVTVTINGVDDDPVTGGLNLVQGTDQNDRLRGTDEADLIISGAGARDILNGFDGADVFYFGSEVGNGVDERDIIRDFEVGVDTIALATGVEVNRIRVNDNQVVIQLFEIGTARNDRIILRGEDLTRENVEDSIMTNVDLNELLS
ncbi:MAG: Ig-like domain-containing protein, partial [Pseudomonadota bacterium]